MSTTRQDLGASGGDATAEQFGVLSGLRTEAKSMDES
jgi:hypothetical protein